MTSWIKTTHLFGATKYPEYERHVWYLGRRYVAVRWTDHRGSEPRALFIQHPPAPGLRLGPETLVWANKAAQ